MIKKYSELEVGRSRPVETITFNPKITGPSGASLVSYTWKYMMDLAEDPLEGTVEKRVSDWENSSPNDETGRMIVHQFGVVLPDGTSKMVSAETVPVLLGMMTKEDKSTFKNVANSAKTLARLQIEKMKMDAAKEKHAKDWEEVKLLPLPTHISAVYEPDFKYTQLKFGDIEIRRYGVVDKRIPSAPEAPESFPRDFFREDLPGLILTWRNKRMEEKGWKTSTIPSDYSYQKLTKRIKTLEKKLNSQKS
jgi:hypothetical protein